jgi:hypothetical protein
LDEPIPAGIPARTPVTVHFGNGDARSVLEEIAELAVDTDDLPPDYSEQHDHYVKGTPRR